MTDDTDRSVPLGFKYFESGIHQQGYTRPLSRDNDAYHARLAAWNRATQEDRDRFALTEWRKYSDRERQAAIAKDATVFARMQTAETADEVRREQNRKERLARHEMRGAEKRLRAQKAEAQQRRYSTLTAPAQVVASPSIAAPVQKSATAPNAEAADCQKLCDIARAKNDALELDAAADRLRVYEAKLQKNITVNPPVNLCGKCGKEALKRCSRCTVVYYCSAEHQQEEWKTHSLTCKAPVASTAAAAVTPTGPIGLIFPPDANIKYQKAYDVTGQSLKHTSTIRPPMTMRMRALESFCGTVDLTDSTHVLNLGDLLRTRDANEGIWAKKYEAADLSMRIAKYFTAHPRCFELLLTSTHMVAPQGDPSNPRLSLPNVTMILAFWRQRYGVTKVLYWVETASLKNTPHETRVVDTGKVTSEVERVLRPFITADRITIAKGISADASSQIGSTSSSSSSSGSDAPPLILSCAHGRMDEKTRNAWTKLGFDSRRSVIDVNVTEAREEDPSIDSKIVSIANVFQQRAVYDRPPNNVYSALIYHGDVYSGIQLAVPAILAGLGWLHDTKIAAMRNGAFTITDPFENTDFDAMMSAYQAHLKASQ